MQVKALCQLQSEVLIPRVGHAQLERSSGVRFPQVGTYEIRER